MKISKDGNMYCITADGFKNLQESDAIFVTPVEVLDFLNNLTPHEWKMFGEYNNPDNTCSRCGLAKKDSSGFNYCKFSEMVLET